MTLDPPVERVDTATFVAKTLAEQLHERLADLGLACIRISIEACTEHGELLSRSWRHGSVSTAGFTATAIADRTRWQLDGWLSGTSLVTPAIAGLVFLRLVPDEVIYDDGRQLALWVGRRGWVWSWGDLGTDRPRAVTGAGHSRARCGRHCCSRWRRDVSEQVRLVSWGESREPSGSTVPPPWPGRLPAPSPATVFGQHSRPWSPI